MKKTLFILFFSLCLPLFADESIVGFWKTINEKTGKAESIIAIYPYQNKYYGRIILTYSPNGEVNDSIENPKERAPGLIDRPYYSGLDILWDLKKTGDKYKGGKILDPEKGNLYGAEAWRNGNNLTLRGKLFFFGRNQTWPPAQESDFPQNFHKPDLMAITPAIPRIK